MGLLKRSFNWVQAVNISGSSSASAILNLISNKEKALI